MGVRVFFCANLFLMLVVLFIVGYLVGGQVVITPVPVTIVLVGDTAGTGPFVY